MSQVPVVSKFTLTARQARSSETAQKILSVAVRLFAAGTLETTPVAELAREAGVSVGGFYGRFRTKADLTRAVAESLLAEIFEPFAIEFAADQVVGVPAAGLVERYAAGLVRTFGGDNRDAVRRLVLLVRSDHDLPTSQITMDQNRAVQSCVLESLLARRDEIGHPDPESAIVFMDLAMSATAREALLHDGTGLEIDTAALTRQLTELGCRFLRIDEPSASPGHISQPTLED